MYASVQSLLYRAFYCRVFAEPVTDCNDYRVYKLAGYDETINQRMNGMIVGTFDHIAVDKAGAVHLFDMEKGIRTVNLGQCKFTPDGPNGPGST